MTIAPPLPELQRQLSALFSQAGSEGRREGFEKAAAALGITGDQRLSGGERLAIYADMIFARFRDAIAEDFPATREAMGREAWDSSMKQYLAAHPSNSPDLRLAGRHLPRFLRDHYESRIADLADLEFALTDSFTAADAEPLELDFVRTLAATKWPDLRLWTIPSLRLLEPTSPSDRNRRLTLGREAASLDEAPPQALQIWRKDLRVFEKRITKLEARALRRLGRKTTFSELCEWLDGQETPQAPSEQAVRFLTSWIEEELVEGSL